MSVTHKSSQQLNISSSIIIYIIAFILLATVLFLFFPIYQASYVPLVKGRSSFINYPKKYDVIACLVLIFGPALACISLNSKIKSFRIILWKKYPQLKNKVKLVIYFLEAKLLSAPLFISLIILALLTRFSNVPFPTDHYHFGEYLLPTYLLKNFDLLPYIDVVPSHGLMNYIPSLLLGNTIQGTFLGLILFSILLNALAAFLLFKKIQSRVLLLSVIFLFPSFRIMYLFALIHTLVWLEIFKKNRISDCILSASILILLSGIEITVGIGMVAAHSALILYYFVINLKRDEIKKKQILTLLTPYLVFFLLLIIPEVRHIIFKMAVTILELARFNLDAFGIPLIESLHDQPSIFILKFCFLPISTLFAIKLWKSRRPYIKAIAIYALVFSLALLSYSVGRIDPGHISRSGWLTCLLLGMIGSLKLQGRNIHIHPFLLLFLVIQIALKIPTSIKTPLRLYKEYSASLSEPYTDLMKVKSIIKDYKIHSSEYLDISNDNLSYYVLQMKPQFPGFSFYNSVTPEVWKRIELNIPRLKLIVVQNRDSKKHDNISLKDRSQKLAFILLEDCHWNLFEKEKLIYFLKKNDCKKDQKDQKLRFI